MNLTYFIATMMWLDFFGSQPCAKSTQKFSVIMPLEDKQKVEVMASQPKSPIKMLGLVFIINF